VTGVQTCALPISFNSLDQALRKDIREYFYGVLSKEKVTTIFVSHDAQDLERVDRMLLMEKGIK
jgi:ABC-type sulfate/molybdate transport systems ATPase subunit